MSPEELLRALGHEVPQKPCPICREWGGFHDSAAHAAVPVPPELTWKPGEKPLWDRNGH